MDGQLGGEREREREGGVILFCTNLGCKDHRDEETDESGGDSDDGASQGANYHKGN